MIRFTVTSDGTTGPEWIERLESKGRKTCQDAKRFLVSSDFTVTRGVTTEVVVLKGVLFEDNDRTTENICRHAMSRELENLPFEVSCFICDTFTYEEIRTLRLLGIANVGRQIPVVPGVYNSYLQYLSAYCYTDGLYLHVAEGRSYDKGSWGSANGFAFGKSNALPQV